MSFTKEKREKVKRYILEKINTDQKDLAKKTAQTFGISLNTVYRYLKELEEKEIIIKNGNRYGFIESTDVFTMKRSKGDLSEEDEIYIKYVSDFIKGFPKNIEKIWQYSFTEMMNNAIDHSEAENVVLSIFQNYLCTTILIQDDGIGIFRKIKEYYNFASLDDAVTELFKGKLTTDKNNHSGEGIFFTSRILDRFAAVSDGKIFTHDKYAEVLSNLDDSENLKDWKDRKGTMIFMELSNFSNKILKEVFDMFADADGGFFRTHIPIKNIYELYPVSRSQAKRLCHRFENFKEVELDFQGIDEIGQGFAHEIFVVFQNAHQDVKLIPINMTEEVKKMVNHVRQTTI